MAAPTKTKLTADTKYHSMPVSIGLIIGALLLSMIDLMFLNDVIGKVLDLDVAMSSLMAIGLGLIGVAIMYHYGMKLAKEKPAKFVTANYFTVWILLGLAFAALRFFAATVMQLTPENSEETLLQIFGLTVNAVDLITAPIMLLLYLATGMLVLDGAKNLHAGPDFKTWNEERKAKAKKKKEDDDAAKKAAREERERIKKEREVAAATALLTRKYDTSLSSYNAKVNQIKAEYKKAAADLDFVKSTDERELQFTNEVKPNLMAIMDASVEGTQNAVALAVRAKTNSDIGLLQDTIDAHNAKKVAQ